MSTSHSRLVEMVDAAQKRNALPDNSQIDPLITPLEIRLAIAAVFSVKFGLYGRLLPPSFYEDLREDLSYLLIAAFGKDALNSRDFKAAHDAAGKDIIDAMCERGF